MKLIWTETARLDLQRVYDFLVTENPSAAAKAVSAILATAETLMQFPSIGEKVEEYEPRCVRRWLVNAYEIHYEEVDSAVYVTNVWHYKEDRPSRHH
jgi:plasmid stabilization system protein ParE